MASDIGLRHWPRWYSTLTDLRSPERVLYIVSMEAVGSSPEQFAATIRSEIAKMAKVIKDAGIKTN